MKRLKSPIAGMGHGQVGFARSVWLLPCRREGVPLRRPSPQTRAPSDPGCRRTTQRPNIRPARTVLRPQGRLRGGGMKVWP